MHIIKQDCKDLIDKIDFEQLRNKSVLVTGASGLVGSYMVACLSMLKNRYNLDIYAWTKSDIDPIFSDLFENVKLIKKDICDERSFSDLDNFDVIIHSAGYGQPGKFLEDKIKTIAINTTATINLFGKLNEGGKFLFVSTSEIYSGVDSENIFEDQIGTTNTDHPRSCYIEGKRCGESICHAFKEKGVDVKIARLSLAYGPGTKKGDHRVLNSLIEKGIKNNSIVLMDAGEAIRTYCYITDVVEMFWNLLLFGKHTVYNVGGRSKTSILELAKLIGIKLNKEVVPKSNGALIGSPKLVNISIKRYTDEFGEPAFKSIEEGLDNTINWQNKLYNEDNA